MAAATSSDGSSQVLPSQLYGVGLGLKRHSDGVLMVNKLAPGGSAALSGRIQSGDILTGVGGVTIFKRPFLEVTQLIVGAGGSSVTLRFVRPPVDTALQQQESAMMSLGQGQQFEVALQRNVSVSSSAFFNAPNARSILHSSLSPAPSTPPALSLHHKAAAPLSQSPASVAASAQSSLSPISKTDTTQPSLPRPSLSAAPAPHIQPSPTPSTPNRNPGNKTSPPETENLLSFESSMLLAAQVTSEHAQQHRPRSAFSPAKLRMQPTTTPSGDKAAGGYAADGKGSNSGAARLDSGFNRLSKAAGLKEKRSMVSSKDVASIIGRADSPFALHSRPTPPPPPPEWMDPDTHDIRRPQQHTPSPSVSEFADTAALAHSDDAGNLTSSLGSGLANSGLDDVRYRGSKSAAALSSVSKAVHVAGDASGTSDSSEAKRMSVSQALQSMSRSRLLDPQDAQFLLVAKKKEGSLTAREAALLAVSEAFSRDPSELEPSRPAEMEAPPPSPQAWPWSRRCCSNWG